jgi:DNA-binding response OmpR family regulator
VTAAPACALCPSCGHNLEVERAVAIGRLSYDPRGFTWWNDAFVRLTPAMHLIVGTLIHARGALVPGHILAERIGYEGDGNVVDVFLTKIRRGFREAGAPANLFENVRGRGHRLNVRLVESLPC